MTFGAGSGCTSTTPGREFPSRDSFRMIELSTRVTCCGSSSRMGQDLPPAVSWRAAEATVVAEVGRGASYRRRQCDSAASGRSYPAASTLSGFRCLLSLGCCSDQKGGWQRSSPFSTGKPLDCHALLLLNDLLLRTFQIGRHSLRFSSIGSGTARNVNKRSLSWDTVL
jgi:hypothetical protein